MIHLLLSFIFTIATFIWVNTLMCNMNEIKELISYGWVDNIGNMIVMGFYAFVILFIVSSAIACAIKSIYHIILFNYEFLFYKEKKIHVTVDDNRNISSYVELSNGKIIPIKIHKVVLNSDKDNTEPKEEESGE